MNNLKVLRKQKGLNQEDLAKLLNVKQNTISNWENDRTQIDRESILFLADYFNVSVDYLLGREIEKTFDSFPLAKKLKDPVIQDEVEINDLYPIPLLGSVVAGIPIERQEDLEGYVFINFMPKEEYFALRVHGESMKNAGILDKSILIVHKQETAECNDIVVAMLNREQTVKRFKRYGENIFLMPENPDFEPIPVTPDDELIILGKVVEVRFSF